MDRGGETRPFHGADMAIRDQYVEIKKSVKDAKPPLVKRPKKEKDARYDTRDVVANRKGGGYQTR